MHEMARGSHGGQGRGNKDVQDREAGSQGRGMVDPPLKQGTSWETNVEPARATEAARGASWRSLLKQVVAGDETLADLLSELAAAKSR